jgi:molybdopterin-dependent oxidoreductase alpha subunit
VLAAAWSYLPRVAGVGLSKHVNPRIWAGFKPLGIGEQRPNNYLEIVKAGWDNRDRLGYAWRILNEGCCDGCALGTTGMRDWTIEGTHLCNVRLRLLRLNTAPPFDPALLADAGMLAGRRASELRLLGRLPHPMVRRRGERGFTRIGWEQALELTAQRIQGAGPQRIGAFLTSRGMSNESYYGVQKAMRAMGTNSIDNAARVCHSPSTFGLKKQVGAAATTCSYSDWIGSDLIVFIGSNVANNQPVAMKYLHKAKAAGTRVVVINPYREPGMERYWVPSIPESALFGTKIADRFVEIDTGGDIAFLTGTLKHMVERDWCDDDFIDRHTNGFAEVEEILANADWAQLERGSGASRDEMLGFAELLHEARTAVFVWSMGVTQHMYGEDNVRAIINLALSKGFVGREKCGLMPIRGHSGVQGGAEMGAYATAYPGGLEPTEENARTLSEQWGFEVPVGPGHTAPELVDAAGRGELDVLLAAGGNFLEVLPDPADTERALARISLRVHMDIVLSPQMFVEPQDMVLLLPATTRYEVPGGVTETSTERRVIFSPEVAGPRVADARPEHWVFGELAARVRPELADKVRFASTARMRDEIAAVVPFYDGIQHLREQGDSFQYGGPMLCAGWRFPTEDGRAGFAAVAPPRVEEAEGRLRLSTRRGKQFNSMVHERRDALTGALRDAVLMAAADAARLGLRDGDPVMLRSTHGALRGNVLIAAVKPGNVQVHWPEGNTLLAPDRRSRESGIPDYNAWVDVEPVAMASGFGASLQGPGSRPSN